MKKLIPLSIALIPMVLQAQSRPMPTRPLPRINPGMVRELPVPNIPELKIILKDLLNLTENKVNIDQIQTSVCQFFKINKTEMLSARRSRYLVRPRQTAIYLAKILTSKSLPEIGRAFSNRDHTEKLFKHLNLPIKINKNKNFEIIKIKGKKQYKGFDYKIPGDISSASFFIALTLLGNNSKILLKNINVNKSRTGILDILKKMNAKIKLKNKKIYKGEPIADISISSASKLKAINCPVKFNSRCIDEFLIIFLICAKAKGVSYFRNLKELRNKESDRLKISINFLKMIGIKVVSKSNNLKIYGNPDLKLNKSYIVKNFKKDHRVFMMSCVAALTLGGKWKILDKDSINSSFPEFLKILKSIGAKINWKKERTLLL